MYYKKLFNHLKYNRNALFHFTNEKDKRTIGNPYIDYVDNDKVILKNSMESFILDFSNIKQKNIAYGDQTYDVFYTDRYPDQFFFVDNSYQSRKYILSVFDNDKTEELYNVFGIE